MRLLSLIAFLCVFFPPATVLAQANEEVIRSLQDELHSVRNTMLSLKTDLEQVKETVEVQKRFMEAQQAKIREMEVKLSPPGDIPQPLPVAAPAENRLSLGGSSQGFNPDIGVAGIVQAHLTEDSTDSEGRDTVSLRELELSLAQYVDPYSRFDAVIDFNDNLENQNADIEEGYYSHWGLPFDFKGQIGKFRSKIGKQNLLHFDQLDTVDFPLVIRDFFGEEGLSSSGLRLQNWIPNPWDMPLELTGEILRGNNGPSFSRVSRRPIFTTHLKGFFEVDKEKQIEWGGSAMFGDENSPVSDVDAAGSPVTRTFPEGQDRYGVHVFGTDLTFNWNLPVGRKLKFQNELYFQDRRKLAHVNHDPWGFYSLMDYRFSRRYSVGLRWDYLEPLDVRDFHGRSIAVSPYLTFWQSEFARFQVQYSHSDSADPNQKSDDAVYLRANFLIGSHKHPVQ